MNNPMAQHTMTLGPMSMHAVDVVRCLEEESAKREQVEIPTEHVLHAGMYARTIMVPKDVALTGALIKIPTILILSGDAMVYTDQGPMRVFGHNVMCGAAGRKQAFWAQEDTFLTMIFPTEAKTVEDAEAEFTDELNKLMSRNDGAAKKVRVGV